MHANRNAPNMLFRYMMLVMSGFSFFSWLNVWNMAFSTSHSGPAWSGWSEPQAVYHFSIVTS